MALVIANTLANGDSTNKSSGQTYTFAPTVVASELVLIGFRTQSTTGTASVSGVTSSGGETVTNIASVNYAGNAVLYCTAWYFIANASGSPTITVTLGGSGLTYAQGAWSVDTVTGHDAGAPITQSAVENSDLNETIVTLGSVPAADSLTWGVAAYNGAAVDVAPETGWTQLGEFEGESVRTVSTIYRANHQSADWTTAGGSIIMIAAEIKAGGTNATATPSAVAVPVTIPSASLTAEANITPSPIVVTGTLPSPSLSGTGVALPAAIDIPVAIPQVVATSEGAATAVPNVIAIPITIPTPNAFATQDATATPAPIAVTIDIDGEQVMASSNITPSPIAVPITLPNATVEGNTPGIATPQPIECHFDFAVFTVDEIKTFAPPADEETPPTEKTTRGLPRRLFRHYELTPRGENVYLIDGAVTTNEPYTTYGSDGQPDEEAWSRVDAVWWGGHQSARVTDDQAALLEGAGYTLGQDADLVASLLLHAGSH